MTEAMLGGKEKSMRKLKMIGLLVMLAAVSVSYSQGVKEYPKSWTYSNVVMNATGTVFFAANPNRLFIRIAPQTLTNDLYIAINTNATLAAKTGRLLKVVATTNTVGTLIPGAADFILTPSDVGFLSVWGRTADGSTPTITCIEANKP